MRVGSLVKYTSPLEYVNMITPDRAEIYTVRDTCMCVSEQRLQQHLGIRLEEIVNPLDGRGVELVYVAEHFTEIQPPMDDILNELLTFTTEIQNHG